MLRRPSDKVRHCYGRAAEARERALCAPDPASKEGWFWIESRWIALAQAIELAESLSEFGIEAGRPFQR
jgi:hypothetical protein